MATKLDTELSQYASDAMFKVLIDWIDIFSNT